MQNCSLPHVYLQLQYGLMLIFPRNNKQCQGLRQAFLEIIFKKHYCRPGLPLMFPRKINFSELVIIIIIKSLQAYLEIIFLENAILEFQKCNHFAQSGYVCLFIPGQYWAKLRGKNAELNFLCKCFLFLSQYLNRIHFSSSTTR